MASNEAIRENRPTALITGSSRGIGFELAKQFARHGHDLILVSRNQAELQHVADKLQRDYDCAVTTVSLDLTTDDAPQTLFSQLDRQLKLLRLNILSLTALSHLFIKEMITRGNGRILNVSSVVAYFSGGPSWASYVASKHYVLVFTRGLAKELAGTGVSATTLCPGPTATEFVSDAGVGATRVYRWIPKVSAADAALAGYQGTMRGRTTVLPGLINKVLAFLGELPPRVISQSVFGFLLRSST